MKNFILFSMLMLGVGQLISQSNFRSAIESKNYASVQKMITSGADVNQILEVDGERMSSLSLAAAQADVEMVNLLLRKGALVSPIIDQRDALMYAAKGGNREIVELLLNKGANVMNETKEGMTAREFALKAGHKEIADMLLSEMQNIVNQAKAKAKNRKK